MGTKRSAGRNGILDNVLKDRMLKAKKQEGYDYLDLERALQGYRSIKGKAFLSCNSEAHGRGHPDFSMFELSDVVGLYA